MWWLPKASMAVLRAATVRPPMLILCQAVRGYSVSVTLPPDIAFDELKNNLTNKQVTVIDVRMPKERLSLGMIPDSKNLALPWLGPAILQPDQDFASKIGFNKPALNEPIVTSCMSGTRARTAQLAFLGAGYTNVRVYVGSFEDWIEQGGKVEFPPEKEKLDD